MPDFFNCATFKNGFVDHLKRRLPQLSPNITAEMIISLNSLSINALATPYIGVSLSRITHLVPENTAFRIFHFSLMLVTSKTNNLNAEEIALGALFPLMAACEEFAPDNSVGQMIIDGIENAYNAGFIQENFCMYQMRVSITINTKLALGALPDFLGYNGTEI